MSPCVFKACRKPSLLSAFSLIELLVVIAIVLALAGIAVNGISNSSQNARQTCREIVKAHLQQARIHAIATHTHTALIIPVRSSGVNGLHEISMTDTSLQKMKVAMPPCFKNGVSYLKIFTSLQTR